MSIHDSARLRAQLSPERLALLEARLRGGSRPTGIVRRVHGSTVPLSSAQERLYFLDRLQPGVAAYNIAEAVHLSGADEAVLERALGEVVRRHDALRTTFREIDGVAAGVVAAFSGFRLPVEDLSGLNQTARDDEALARLSRESAHVFDLAKGPLFRPTLLRMGGGDHVLILCLHHIVFDGWSTQVLFRELWALYGACSEGRESPLPELAIQYADYAAWQREQAGGEAEARQLRYWKERLSDVPDALELPADRPRPAHPSFRGGAVPVEIPHEVAERLRALARDERTTLYVVALAAFKALLAYYAGSGDVIVGGVTAGRTRSEVEGLIGLFVNTLALRTDLSGDPPFREGVGRVRECLLGAFQHQDLPFERLVAELRPERTLSQSPLFRVMFLLNHLDQFTGVGERMRARRMEAAECVANFDLTLELHAHAAGVSGTLEYAADLFDRSTALRMAGHLERLVEAAAADPDRRLSRLEPMDPAERALVVDAWNGTDADVDARCIHDLFRERVDAAPGETAILFRDGALTRRELDERANRLAHALVARGARPESRVGICLERSAQWPVALLAALKAGAAYVPLDPAYPPGRLAFMLEDCGASVLVTQDSLRGCLPAGIPVVSLDGDGEAIAALPSDPPRTLVVPGNAAYVIYTSGSTGRPKGVQVTHANAANLFAGMHALLAGAVPGTWLAQASISFDMHVVELLWTLVRGFRVVLLPGMSSARRDETPAALIRRHAVTHFQCTPSLAAVMVAEWGVEAFSGLDRLLLGGEALPSGLAARIAAAHPGILLDLYGPTETCVWSAAHRVERVDGAVPVGRPLANQRVFVLDDLLRPRPVGAAGELYVGGRGVSRGYLDRPGLTAERFVPDPFSREPGARLYRTGDRGRWRGDGLLEFLGRADEQVKVNGFRIEPGEIESALCAHPAVRECAVVAREDRPGEKRLAAYVVGDAADSDGLRAFLHERLPRHMVPDAFVALAALPLSPNGKLDRRALPAPGSSRAARIPGPPADGTEARLIAIWEELLGVEGIGPTESFFALGGNSILALRLFARVNARLGCDLPVASLFTGATVRHMARAIRGQASAGEPASPLVALQPDGALPPLFLVHAMDGDVMPYLNVVRHLGPDQPVFGLRDTGDFARPLARIAAEHVRTMRSAQPHGPYYLAGWSFGGWVAFEMALQLESAGECVAFTGLIDAMAPALASAWPAGDADVVAGLAHEIAGGRDSDFPLAPAALAGLDFDAQVRAATDALLARAIAPGGFDPAAFAVACRLHRDRIASRAGWAPGRLNGTLTLFRATDLPVHVRAFMAGRSEGERHDLGWSSHAARRVEVHPIPGGHHTVAAEPHAGVLVECLRASLAASRRRVDRETPVPA